MNSFILLFYCLLCLSLSHAQTAPPLSIPSLPNLPTSLESIKTTPPATAPTTTITPTPSTSQSTTTTPTVPPPTTPAAPAIEPPVANITGPKYVEYQSVCRTHEYDQVFYLSDALKEKRILFLQDKIKKDPDSIKLKTRLLKEYADQKLLKEAEQTLIEIRKLKTTDDELRYAEAIRAFSKGDKKAAREMVDKILVNQPKNVEVLKFLAEVYKEEANFFEYQSIYYDLAKITKESYDEQLCEAYTLDSHFADAEKLCLKGAAENKNPLFHIYLGVAAREKENFQQAQKHFLNSLRVKETEMGLVCSAEVYLMQKKHGQAQENLKKAIALSPKSLRAHLALAWSLFEQKNLTEALTTFESACAISKKSVSDLRRAVKILIEQKSDLTKSYSTQAEKCGN